MQQSKNTQIVGIKKNNLIHDITILVISQNSNYKDIDLSPYLKSLHITKLFEDSIKPIYRLEFTLPLATIETLQQMKNYRYHVIIKSAHADVTLIDNNIMPPNYSNKKTEVFNSFLIPYNLPKAVYSPNTEALKGINTPGNIGPSYPYEVECFDIRHIHTNIKIASFSYRNQPLINTIIDLLNWFKSNKALQRINNLVICPPDTKDPIETITIPPMNMKDIFTYLQDKFNIYNRKMILFLDEDTLYLVKRMYSNKLKNGKADKINVLVGNRKEFNSDFFNTSLKKLNENEIVYITENISGLIDKSSIVLNSNPDKVIIKSDSGLMGLESQCVGIKDDNNNLNFLKNNKDIPIINSEYVGKEEFINDNYNTKQYVPLLVDKAQSQAYHINIYLKDAFLDHFNVTTQVLLTFSTKNLKHYDGKYYIKSVNMVYSMDDSSNIEAFTELQLGRIF